jgi:hypothetical protein
MANKLNYELFERYSVEFAGDGIPTQWVDLDDSETITMLNREMEKAMEVGKPIPERFFNFPDDPTIVI